MEDITMEIYDNCGCDELVEEFVKDALTRANIKACEVVICDMDYKRIRLRVEEWDDTLPPEEGDEEYGGWIEQYYVIKYQEDPRFWYSHVLSYVLYNEKGVVAEAQWPDMGAWNKGQPEHIDEDPREN